MKMLRDSFGRSFPYIRLSITDVCNFKCGYCLPNGYQVDKSDNRKFLHLEEIRRLAKVFSKLGVCKIRLTGGEPTVRKDFFDIIKILKDEAGIKKVVITTNGYHLDKKAKMLVDSGLNGINISIDSLDRNNEYTKEHMEIYYVGNEAANSKKFKSLRKQNFELWKGVQIEDLNIIEGMQDGRKSPSYNGGNFSPAMDNPTHHFHKWVANNIMK